MKRLIQVPFIILLVLSLTFRASAFDIIYDLPPISAKLSEGNRVVTITFETAPNPGEYIMVYSAWDAFKTNEPVAIQDITNHDRVQIVRLDEPAQANVFVSYAPLHTSEGGQIESRVVESTGYTASHQSDPIITTTPGKITTDFRKLPIYDVLESTYELGDTDDDLTVLIVGRVNCGLTTGNLRNIKNLLTRLNIKNTGIYLLDLDNTKDNVKIYAEQNSDIHTAWNNGNSVYNNLFWEIQRASSSISSSGSAVLPSLCVLDSSLQPVYYAAGTSIDITEMERVLSSYGVPQESESVKKDDNQSATTNVSNGEESSSSGTLSQADSTSDDALRELLAEMGVDVEKALAALKTGGTYSEKEAAITPIGVLAPDDDMSGTVSVERLSTNFSKLPIYDVVNGEYLLGDSGADLSILMIGNPLCSYTIKRVQFVQAMLEALNVKNARLYLLDMGAEVGSTQADAERFAEKNPGVFVARASGNSDIYYRLFFEVCRSKGKTGGRFPAICVLDRECTPIYTTTEVLFDENELNKVLQPYTAVAQDDSNTEDSQVSAAPFLDVQPNSYYADAVVWAVGKGITAGNSANTFAPDIPCTRAQTVTFLWRAAGSPTPQGNMNPFEDVQVGNYYYNAVMWAVEQGITSGTSATTFSPDATVTRGQTVTFLYRAAGSPAVSGNNAFTDVGSGLYCDNAVQWAVSEGITAGTSTTTFSPNENCTRAQIVTFLYRDRA